MLRHSPIRQFAVVCAPLLWLVAACAEAHPAEFPSRAEQHEASMKALLAQNEAKQAEADKVAAARVNADLALAIDQAAMKAVTDRLATCTPMLRSFQAKEAEWEQRAERVRQRDADRSWARANCRWDNAPRTRLEVESHRENGATVYEVNKRYSGVARSVAKCPLGTSADRMRAADDVANSLVSDGRIARDGPGDRPLAFGKFKEELEWCRAHQPQAEKQSTAAPDTRAPSEPEVDF